MVLPKAHSSSRDTPIEDPLQIREGLSTLFREQVEFSIKVEGTSTLPYASVVKVLDLEKGFFILKLVRPLPHELLKGAEFRMLFAVADQRLEALIQFVGREEYLQYRFTLPTVFTLADRRDEKRYPFRPRESAFVSAQDGAYPGLGVTGALVNISQGGLAMRVDRVLKLDDGMRIPPNTALFDRGHAFTRIRVMDIPRFPLFEASGVISHATDRGGEIVLGFQFTQVREEALQGLSDALAFREKLQRAAVGGMAEGAGHGMSIRSGGDEGAAGKDGVEPGEAPRLLAQEDPMKVLARRATGLVLLDPGDPQRAHILSLLRLHAFYRIDVVADPEAAALCLKAPGRPPVAVLACLAEGVEPLAGVRALEHQMEALGEVPLGILCQDVDPAALMALGPRTRLLSLAPRTPLESHGLVKALEHLVGLEA